jgi:hypothetical protein
MLCQGLGMRGGIGQCWRPINRAAAPRATQPLANRSSSGLRSAGKVSDWRVWLCVRYAEWRFKQFQAVSNRGETDRCLILLINLHLFRCFIVFGEGAGNFQIGGPISIKISQRCSQQETRNGRYFRHSYQRFGCFTHWFLAGDGDHLHRFPGRSSYGSGATESACRLHC